MSEEAPVEEEAPVPGVIEACHGPLVAGFARAPEGPTNTIVEFTAGGRIVGRAALQDYRPGDEGYAFELTLDVHGLEEVTAVRLPDGAPLLNSPFLSAGPPLSEEAPEKEDAPPAWATWIHVAKPLRFEAGRELALFVTHSATGALKPHVRPYLEALTREGMDVLLVAVTDRQLNVPPEVLELCAGALIRGNLGYDFAAWAHALRLYPEAYGAGILYLVNDSLIGPSDAQSFATLIERVRASEADLVGLTESHEYRWHLQSYFLALKGPLLASFALQTFFGDVKLLYDKDAVIRAYELRFASAMEQAGFTVERLFPSTVALNPTLFAWRALLAQGFPFVKLLMLRGAFPDVDLTGWRESLARAGFDLDLVDATLQASEEDVPYDYAQGAAAHPIVGDDEDRPLKVAFYGPWNYDNGLGSASRGAIAALRRTGARLNLHPIKQPFHVHRPTGPAVDVIAFEGPADVAVVHLNPDSWFLLTDDQRGAIRAAGRRIGYWVWEMGHIPAAWWADFGSVDRIWSPSSYCAELFAAQDGAPVDVIPHAVPLPVATAGDRAALTALGVAEGRRTILFVFDGSSYLVRKNPAALIRAFAASGLGARGWTLLLKTKHLMDRPEDGAALKALADATAEVRLVDRAIPAGALMALIAAADIYASPHSSEGFGLTIAEAMAAGKPVVATDFGGSADFLDAGCGYPVAAEAYVLDEDFGHYTAGGEWARVDEDALSEALVRAADAVEAGDTRLGEGARARIGERLSYAAVGAAMARSLAETVSHAPAFPPVQPLTVANEAGTAIEEAAFEGPLMALPLRADGSAGLVTVDAAADWIVIAPEGSRIAPELEPILLDFARRRPDVSIFYGDDVAGRSAQPIDQVRLKPEFDLTLLRSQDYVGAPLMVRASAFKQLGGLREAAGTAAAADLLLRAHAAGCSIARIPEILLLHPGERVRATAADHAAMLRRQPGLAGYDVAPSRAAHSVAVTRRFEGAEPAVTLIVPTRRSERPEGGAYVARLLEGLAATDWPMDRLTVIVGDDVVGEPDWETRDWPFTLRRIETPRGADEPFNYAAKMNRMWREAANEAIVFVNDDVSPSDPAWLRALMTYAVDPGVGGVGARLLYEDGRLQHAGLGPHGPAAAHLWIERRRTAGSYQDWALTSREWSMVTGAVFATRRSLMDELDGFDENFRLEYNDIDLCLRLRLMGYRIVYAAGAELTHAEKASRGDALPPAAETAAFLAKWKPWLDADPSFHPGYDRARFDLASVVAPDAWFL